MVPSAAPFIPFPSFKSRKVSQTICNIGKQNAPVLPMNYLLLLY